MSRRRVRTAGRQRPAGPSFGACEPVRRPADRPRTVTGHIPASQRADMTVTLSLPRLGPQDPVPAWPAPPLSCRPRQYPGQGAYLAYAEWSQGRPQAATYVHNRIPSRPSLRRSAASTWKNAQLTCHLAAGRDLPPPRAPDPPAPRIRMPHRSIKGRPMSPSQGRKGAARRPRDGGKPPPRVGPDA